jgi:UDP-glucose 4-epimerase
LEDFATKTLRVFVTGGAGFIGGYLVDFLLKIHMITVYDDLSNSQSTPDSLTKKGVQFVKGSIMDCDKLVEAAKGCDMVIHLAAKTDIAESVLHPEMVQDVNVNGTVNVLRCCIKNNIKKIVFASSAAVYGDSDIAVTENADTKPSSPYGNSKVLAENKIKEMSGNNLEYVVLRLFNVYGKRQNKADVISKFAECTSRNIPLVIYGDGKQTRDFVSISDVTEAFDCATKANSSGTYNVASGRSISINELAKMFLDISGKKIEIQHMPSKKGDIKHSKADITLAKKELGFNPSVDLKDGLSELISVSD